MIACSSMANSGTGPTYCSNGGYVDSTASSTTVIIAPRQLYVYDCYWPTIEVEFHPLFPKKHADVALNMRCAIERINTLCKVIRPKINRPLLPRITRLMLFCKSGFVGRVAKRLKGRL